MAEPKIVFCSNNHIYDAAINDECPYCKKITSEQKELSDTVNGLSGKGMVAGQSFSFADDDSTELISGEHISEDEYTELISREDEGEYTELIARGTDVEEDSTELISQETGVEDEYTELIRHESPVESSAIVTMQKSTSQLDSDIDADKPSNESKLLPNTGRVMGWLVLKNGTNAGHSIEICQETKYIYELQGSCITSSEPNDEIRLLATIENEDALSIIPEKDVVLTVNGADKKVYRFPRSYDELELDIYHISYIEIMAHFMRWED